MINVYKIKDNPCAQGNVELIVCPSEHLMLMFMLEYLNNITEAESTIEI